MVIGNRSGCWFVLIPVWLVGAAPQAIRAEETVSTFQQAAAERAQLDESFRQRLAELQLLCHQLDLPAQAEATARWFPVRDPRRQYLFLPSAVDPLKPADDAPKIVHQWYARLTRERQQRAEELFQFARRQLERDASSSAYQLLHEVLHEDPDHAAARQALGYRRVGDQWARPTARLRVRQLRTANPSLGIARSPYWLIESENFSIATTHSEAAGRQLAEQLEVLHAAWSQLFFPLWSNTAALARRFEVPTSSASGSGPRLNVVLFRDRDEYLSALKPIEPMIEMTTGFYSDKRKAAFFFVEGQSNPNVVYHEVTHQLFSETGRVAAEVGRDSHFWIVEGIALYMESLKQWNGYCTVGGIDAGWLQYARYRALHEQFYLPLDQLIRLGRRQLQEHPEIRRLYSQSAGLAAMLMDDRHGIHRHALTEYLRAVYAGRTQAETLSLLTGEPLTALDAQYRQFLDVTDRDLSFLAAMPGVKQLSLGRTSITNAGLEHLAPQTGLTWLDLGVTPVGDEGFAHLRAATNMNQLSLTQTRITDQSLAIVGTFRNLEILDLSGTAITDQGLKHLAGLPKLGELWIEETAVTDRSLAILGTFGALEILDLSGTSITDDALKQVAKLANLRELWIARTAVTDAGLEHLRGLKNLETLDVGDTQVTTEGWNRLRAALPSLEP